MYTRWTNAQPLELHGAWISNMISNAYRSPTCVPISNVRTQLTALGRCTPWAQALDPTPGSRRRWSYVHPLDKRTAVERIGRGSPT